MYVVANYFHMYLNYEYLLTEGTICALLYMLDLVASGSHSMGGVF